MRNLTLGSAILAALLGGCSTFQSEGIDYKSAGKLPPLEVPPDLVAPTSDGRFAVPDVNPRGGATYSAYAREREGRPQTASGNTAILPDQDKVRIERAGSQRWLVVQAKPEEVWPVIRDFWQELGFIVNLEVPEAGVMETDWAENRAKIPQDAIRNLLGKVLDSFYSTAERDKFRTRLERAADGGTEIYISHRGMIEVFETEGKDKTVWQPRPADPDLEAEMLRRLMVRFGVEKARAETLVAQQQLPDRAVITRDRDGLSVLTLPEPFDRAWRRVGLALDRIGFVVEDRDRSKGVFFVRYHDPEMKEDKKGFLSRLAFWRDEEKKELLKPYRVAVDDKGNNTLVSVADETGKPLATSTGTKIVNLLYEQLK